MSLGDVVVLPRRSRRYLDALIASCVWFVAVQFLCEGDDRAPWSIMIGVPLLFVAVMFVDDALHARVRSSGRGSPRRR